MVLFTSVRPLERAENIKTVYDAYDGPKEFIQRSYSKPIENIERFSVMVTDGLLEQSPGKYLWIGHGMGAGKTIGLQHPTAPFRASELVTYAIASSEDIIPIVAGFCGISPDKVVPLGMPRTDAYFKVKKTKSEEKRHLYAPTFRAGYWHPDFDTVSELLPEGHRFIYKPHMVTGDGYTSSWSNITFASSKETSTQYLVDADTVVTDYSSIMFDAMVLKKPIVLFCKDKDEYLKSRGMYCTYPAMYSDCCCDNEETLVESLQNVQWTKHMEELREYHAGACDGHSTERCIDLIRSMV